MLVKLPRMTQETIDRMIKLVHMEAEGAHQSIRRARQKGMDAVKKAFKLASQDEKKRQEKEVGADKGGGGGEAGVRASCVLTESRVCVDRQQLCVWEGLNVAVCAMLSVLLQL